MTLVTILALVALLAAAPTAGAEAMRTVSWDDLVPRQQPLSDPLAEVPLAVRYDLGFVAQVMADARAGLISETGAEFGAALAVREQLRARGLDVDRLVTAVADRDSAIRRRRNAVNPDLDGEVVRLPGYALPLGGGASAVHEFLLVPYVGACIHYPPPPPNQVVRAELRAPHRFERRFDTVWITGRLSARPSSRSLSYVDGQATVATGYTMDVFEVQPFDDDPAAQRAGTSFSSAEPPALKTSRRGGPHRSRSD